VQDGIEPENSDFAEFRTQAFELVRDFEPCLTASIVMAQVTTSSATAEIARDA